VRKKYFFISGIGLIAFGLSSCSNVKPYQKQYLNDHYMQTNSLPNEKLEAEAESYREGMMGGTDGKAGGGCGCN